MKLAIAIATTFLAISTTLPALAATPVHEAATPIASAQYRQMPQHRMQVFGNARQAAAGGTCVDRSDPGSYSAFPNWEVCG
jgi:hypothetical protein